MGTPQQSHKVLQEGTRKHAQRKNPAEWKKYKPIICEKYKSEPLKDVMVFMEINYGFKATKRQYVHQLKKWSESKYNKGSVPIEPPFGLESKSNVGKAKRKHQRGESSSSLEMFDNERSSRSRTLSTQESIDHGEHAEMLDHPDTRWLIDPYREDTGRSHLPERERHDENTGLILEAKRRAADFFFAMSFDREAFGFYKQCYDLLDGLSELPLTPSRPSLVLAMGRSAQIPEHMETVRKILRRHLPMTETETQTPMAFLCRMLEAYMSDRSKDRNSAKTSIEDILNNLVGDKRLLLWSGEQGMGIIPFPFLVYGVQRYNEGKEAEYCIDQKSIVEDFLSQLEGVIDHSLDNLVHDCVLWCIGVLDGQPETSPVWHHIPCNYEDLRGWNDDNEVFCYIWHLWQVQYPVGARQPSWVERAEQQLGISATELLVTISWLIMEGVDEDEDDDLLDDYHSRLIQCALSNARKLANLGGGDLWDRFLARLDWMNTLVDIGPKDKEFKATTLQYVRKYVADTLHIDIPTVEGDCYGAHSRIPDPEYYHPGAQSIYGVHSQFHASMIPAQKTLIGVQLDLC